MFLMWKISIHLSRVIYSRNRLNLQDSSSRFLMMQARRTLLFDGTTPWIKKSGDEDLDVSMGCFDGAEICKLVGTYIQSKYHEQGGRRIIS